MDVFGQTDGLERVIARRESLAACNLSVSKRPYMRDLALYKAAAPSRCEAHSHQHQNLISLFEELFRDSGYFVERPALVFEEARDFVATLIRAGVWQAIIRFPLQIRT